MLWQTLQRIQRKVNSWVYLNESFLYARIWLKLHRKLIAEAIKYWGNQFYDYWKRRRDWLSSKEERIYAWSFPLYAWD